MTYRVVWKFILLLSADPQRVEMPLGARIVHVGMQDGMIGLWFECNPMAPRETREFVIFGTGDVSIPEGAEYRGTVFQSVWVWHVYELNGR